MYFIANNRLKLYIYLVVDDWVTVDFESVGVFACEGAERVSKKPVSLIAFTFGVSRGRAVVIDFLMGRSSDSRRPITFLNSGLNSTQ